MNKRIYFAIMLYSFFLLVVACGKEDKKVVQKDAYADSYHMEEIVLKEKESLVEGEYRKMKCIGEKYYILSDYGKKGELLVLNQKAELTASIVFEKEEETRAEDFYIAGQGQSFHVISAQAEEEKNKVYLDEYDAQGKVLCHSQIAEAESADWIAVEKGCLFYDYHAKVFTMYDKDGKKLWEKGAGEYWQDGMVEGGDGSIYVMVYGENHGIRRFWKINPLNGKTEKEYETGFQFSEIMQLSCGENDQEILLCNDKEGVFDYDFEKQEAKKLIDWTGSGMDVLDCGSLCVFSEGEFLCLCREQGSGQNNSDHGRGLWKLKLGEKTEKNTLVVGVNGVSERLAEAVSKFNREHSQVMLELRDYFQYEDAQKQLMLDLTTGNSPDIFDVSLMNTENLIEKGALADLYPFMEADDEMKPEKFQKHILELLERDGKLYVLPEEFHLHYLVCSRKWISGKDISEATALKKGLSLHIMEEIWEEHPGKRIMMVPNNQISFLNYILSAGKLERFLESDEMERELTELLAFAKKLPSMEERELVDDEEKAIREGEVLFQEVWCFDPLYETECYRKNYGKNGYYLFGYPCTQGSGIWTGYGNGGQAPCFGISSSCKDMEMAWQFVRSFYTLESQEDVLGIPIRNDAFEKLLNTKNGDFSLTKKEKESWRKLINAMEYYELPGSSQKELIAAVAEEAVCYFSEEKTLEKCVEQIKSRIRLYVSEQN